MPAESVALGDLLQPASRPVSVAPTATYRLLGVRLNGNGPFLREEKTGAESSASTLYQVRAGDFIFSRLFAWRGAFGIVPEELDGCFVSNEFPTYRIDERRVDPRLLRLWFQLPETLATVEAQCTGTTKASRNRFKERHFEALRFPLPSLDEQHVIAARVGEADALLARLTATLAAADADLAAFRRRLLQDAVEGRLSTHDPADEPAPVVPLRSVLREKSRNGYSGRPTEDVVGAPLLRISAGTSRADHRVDEADHRFAPVRLEEVQDLLLEPGDLLACRFNGSLHLVGRFSLFEGSSKAPRIFPDKLIRFRVAPGKADPRFVLLAMNGPEGRRQIQALCSTTAGNIGLSANRLNDVTLPLPPLAEQRRIVARVEALTAVAEAFAARLRAARDDARALRARLLHDAFAA